MFTRKKILGIKLVLSIGVFCGSWLVIIAHPEQWILVAVVVTSFVSFYYGLYINKQIVELQEEIV